MIVKKALSKHTSPVSCNICEELMKNEIGYVWKEIEICLFGEPSINNEIFNIK